MGIETLLFKDTVYTNLFTAISTDIFTLYLRVRWSVFNPTYFHGLNSRELFQPTRQEWDFISHRLAIPAV